jgi:ParB/RepB/Spo0J family partition protein
LGSERSGTQSGRVGYKALIGAPVHIRDLAEKRGDLLFFDPRKLVVEEYLNARDMASPDTVAWIEELAGKIKAQGVRNPLMVRVRDGNVVTVVHGHCRLAAVLALIEQGDEIATVPCIAEPKGTNDVDRWLQQDVDNSSKPLTALEQGHNFKRAIAKGLSVKEVAERVGLSTWQVSRLVDLQGAPIEIHNHIKSGAVSATTATDLVRTQGDEKAKAILDTAVERAQGKRVTKKHVEEALGQDFDLRKARIRRAAGDSLKVRIGRVDYVFPVWQWENLANRILDTIGASENHGAPAAAVEEAVVA